MPREVFFFGGAHLTKPENICHIQKYNQKKHNEIIFSERQSFEKWQYIFRKLYYKLPNKNIIISCLLCVSVTSAFTHKGLAGETK